MKARLVQAYQSSTLRTKISLLAAAVFLAVSLISQTALYLYVSRVIEERAQQTANATITQVQTSLENQLRGLVERLYYIRVDPAFEDALTDYLLDEGSPAAHSLALSQLSPCLSLYKATEPLISSLYLYTPKGSFTDMGLATEQGYQFEGSTLWQQVTQSPAMMTWGKTYTDEIFITHRQVVPLMYRFTVEGCSQECVLLANIDQSKLTSALRKLLPETESGLLILDENGCAVTQPSGPGALLMQSPDDLATIRNAREQSVSLRYDGDVYRVLQRKLSASSWQVVYLQSETTFYHLLEKIGGVFLFVNLVALLVILLAVMRIVHSVTTPLSQLSDCMQEAEAQTQPKPFRYPHDNEIGKLAKSYNSLLAHNARLLQEQESYIEQLRSEKEQLRIEQQLKRRAELKALQAQINPHFLYNTLDSIHWKAERANVPDISEMTLALATLFRVGLSRGYEIIPLEQELRHVDSYLQIQKHRYGDRLNYRVELPPELLALHTVKLILQPLVENAIYHGIKENDKPGTITVTGQRVGDVLELRVIDDGLGIPAPRLHMIQADLKRGLSVSNDGYGIYNVNERIRLYFGAEYGLTLESVFEKGTVATVRLPCITEKEAERYVSLTDC